MILILPIDKRVCYDSHRRKFGDYLPYNSNPQCHAACGLFILGLLMDNDFKLQSHGAASSVGCGVDACHGN